MGLFSVLNFFHHYPDRVGREKIFKYSILFNAFLHLNFLFCLNSFHLILINFFGGLNSFLYIVAVIYITEYLPIESNGINIGIINTMNPSYGIILYSFLKISKNWRIIFLDINNECFFCWLYLEIFFRKSKMAL